MSNWSVEFQINRNDLSRHCQKLTMSQHLCFCHVCDASVCQQMSVESTWSLLGLLDRDQLLDTVDSSSVATDTGSSTTGLLQPLRSRSVSPPSPLTDAAKTRSSVIGGLDIHSCLQFLLDLYGQVLSPLATPRTPLMQLNATIRSVGQSPAASHFLCGLI